MDDIKTRYPIGTRVQVLAAYRGSGRFAPDGDEGEWYTVGHCGPDNLKLARHAGDPWDRIVHLQRIAGDPAAAWRRNEYGRRE